MFTGTESGYEKSYLHWMLGFENPPISQISKLSPKEKKRKNSENRALLILASNRGPEGGITAASWHNLGKGKRNQGPRVSFSFGTKPMVCGEVPACSLLCGQQKWNQGLRGSI